MLKRFLSFFLCFAAAITVTASSMAGSDAYYAEAASVEAPNYYYNQLSEDAQKVYDILRKTVFECRESVTIRAEIAQEDFDMIAELIALHDPMTFNIEDIMASNITRNLVNFEISYIYDKETYDEMVSAYEKRADKILSKLTDNMTAYEKIKKIHDLIISNAEYDLDSPANENLYGTLVRKKGKCDGYAKTFSYICGRAGIETVTVIGHDLSDQSDVLHMWNKVNYKGKWYNVDTTWDDPVSNMRDNTKYDFFMVSDSELQKSHKEDNLSFKVPKATDNSKNYFKVYKKYAEDLESAESIMKKELKSAVKKEKACISFQCSSKEVFDEVKKYVLNTRKVSTLLHGVKKSNKTNLADTIYSYNFNENQYIVKLLVFYEDTDLDYYFSDLDTVSSNMLNVLANYGIE